MHSSSHSISQVVSIICQIRKTVVWYGQWHSHSKGHELVSEQKLFQDIHLTHIQDHMVIWESRVWFIEQDYLLLGQCLALWLAQQSSQL